MEEGIPYPLYRAEFTAENGIEQHCSGKLYGSCHLQDELGELEYAADMGGGNGVLHHAPEPETYLFSGKPCYKQSYGYDTHTAYLYKREYDYLSEERPVCGCVPDNKAGNTGGGYGSEEGIPEGRDCAFL